MPNETLSDAELIEQLTLQAEQLTEQNEQLHTQLSELQEQLALSESHNTQLTTIIDASAEDLQLFGSLWLKPSTVRTVAYQQDGGIHIDGISIEESNRPPTEQIAMRMQQFAKRINDLNAERRARARRKKNNP